jgi:hypothetical protein
MIRKAYILIIFSLTIAPLASAAAFDHSKFDRLLKTYVDDQGSVDYNAISQDARFQEYIQSLKLAKTAEMTPDGQLAFWINAYNAVTIDKVIKWKPKKSVRETLFPGVWTSTKFFTTREHLVAGRHLSQDDIEHEILRKQLNDPRIHFAIVCASSSCPKLARFAYTLTRGGAFVLIMLKTRFIFQRYLTGLPVILKINQDRCWRLLNCTSTKVPWPFWTANQKLVTSIIIGP